MHRLVFPFIFVMAFNLSYAQDLAWTQVLKDIRSSYPTVPQLSIDSLAARLDADDVVLLDARESDEYAVSHLPGAIRIDPNLEDLSVLEHLDKDTPIVAYCSVGYRSSALAQRLQEAGYTNVANLESSIFGWANSGHPVFRENSIVRGVHPYNSIWGQLLNVDLRQYEP